MRRCPFCHFDRRNPQTPNIRSSIVMSFFDHLRSNPKRTPYHCLSFVDSIGQFRRHPKIRQLDMPIIGQQHIPALNIPMTNLLLMQILQSQHDPRTSRPNRLLRHGKTPPPPRRLDQIRYRPTVAKLHNDPHLSCIQLLLRRADEAFKVSHDIGRIALRQDVDLAHDFVRFGVAFVVGNDFDGDDSTGGFVAGAKDLAEGAFAKHFLDFELIGAILCRGILLVGRGIMLIKIAFCKTKIQ
mmetsp:Transcript_19759/g.40439  ORF Transcript_19759/g.40439 Transcript_19759/m.40439 type:complete len:240 (+) Transcript_19759:1463-2182(+)